MVTRIRNFTHTHVAGWCLTLAITISMLPTVLSASIVNGQIKLVTPSTPVITASDLQEITVDIGTYAGPVVVLLNNHDMTALVERRDGLIIYRLPEPLTTGTYRLQVWTIDASGPGREKWDITVIPAGTKTGVRRLYSNSALSLSASSVSGDNTNSSDVQGNLALDLGMESGKGSVSLQGNFAYTNNPESTRDELEPTGYVLTVKHDDDSIAIGDVSFTGTPLTAPSLARRGALATLNLPETSLQLVQVSSNTVTGWDSGLGSQNQIYGAAITHNLNQGDQPLRISAAVLDGEINDPTAASNVASIDAASRGKVAGLGLNGRLFDTGINLDTGWSDFDSDTTDATDSTRDKAATLQLDKSMAGIAWTANYLYAGPEFSSVANPGAMRDREQLGLAAGTGFGASTLSMSVSRSHDNVGSDNTQPVVFNDSAGLTYALAAASWPALSLSYMVGEVYSTDEPPATTPTENNSTTASATLNYSRQIWYANLALSHSKIEDPLNGDSTASSQQLAFSYQPSQQWNLAPTLAHNQTERAAITEQTMLFTFTGNWHITSRASLAGQVAFNQNDADDNSIDNRQQNAVVRFNWDISQEAQKLFPEQQGSLYLSFTHSKYNDDLNTSLNTDDNTVFIGISINQPLHGEYQY